VSAAPRLAATVVVLRPAAAGAPAILIVTRARGASFMADAFVFPGGRVDEADAAQADPADALAAFRIAAVREAREEAAVAIDPRSLVPLSRWITPSAEPKRFDACFFVAAVAAGTEAEVDRAEVTERVWASASALLHRHAAREMKLPPPTLRTLEELAPQADIASILRWAAGRALEPIQPKLVPAEEGLAILLPWHAGYAAAPGEGAPIAPSSVLAGGSARYVLRDGYFCAD